MTELKTYTMKLKCGNCLFEFMVNIKKGVIVEDYIAECPNCGMEENCCYHAKGGFLILREENAIINLNKDFSIETMNQVITDIKNTTGARCCIEVRSFNWDHFDSIKQQFKITYLNENFTKIPTIKSDKSWLGLLKKIEELKEKEAEELSKPPNMNT